MSTRRHLPILREPATAPAPPAAAPAEEPPPWHWIPLGTTLSIVAFALLAQGAAALSVRLLERVFPHGATAADVARITADRPGPARAAMLGASAIPIAALLVAIGLGGYVVGRRGDRTNARHGMLSGGLTLVVFWAFTGRAWSMLALLPFAMAAGHLAARIGVHRRERAAAG